MRIKAALLVAAIALCNSAISYAHPASEAVTARNYYAVDNCPGGESARCRKTLNAGKNRVGKSDIAAMERLYYENDPSNGHDIKFTQWAPVFSGNGVEIIWANNGGEDLTGAIFQRKDGGLSLIAETGRNRKPSIEKKDGKDYLSVAGSAGGPSWYQEIYVFEDGRLTETFTSLEVYGKIDVCAINGQAITLEEGTAYIESLPQFHPLAANFTPVR